MKIITLRRSAIFCIAASCLGLFFSPRPATAAEPLLEGAAGQARMEWARSEIANARSNIVLALLEMDRARSEQGPERPQLKAFGEQLVTMETQAKAIGQRAAEMKSKGPAYFAAWEAKTAEIQDPVARKKVEKSYSERKTAYNQINSLMQEARAKFLPLVEQLRGIQAALEGGAGAKSDATNDLFLRANWNCVDVQKSLMSIEDQFERLATSFGKART